MAATLTTEQFDYVPVPVEGLVEQGPLEFPLYLRTAPKKWVLYREVSSPFTLEHAGRLHSEGVTNLYIRDVDRSDYYRRVETQLDRILRDPSAPLKQRARVLHGVATEMARDVLEHDPTPDDVRRSARVLGSTASLVLREPEAFVALRSVLRAGEELATHSLTVAVLSIGLARVVQGAEPNIMLRAGLAGLLHDVGKIGLVEGADGPEHVERGHAKLQELGVDAAIAEVALLHHERTDGSGYPRGLRGAEIPPLVRVVGLANTFENIYSQHQPRVGVYDSLRILAQAYRGCFDGEAAAALIGLFRP